MLSGDAVELHLRPRPVVDSVEDLIVGCTDRQPFLTDDSKSGSRFERLLLDGHPHIIKYVHVDNDFTMRCSGDLGPRPLLVWQSGLMDLASDLIEHGTVGVARGVGRNGWGAAILMRDLSTSMVPPGDLAVTVDQHLRFIDHVAAMASRSWGWRDTVGLMPYQSRWQWFGPDMESAERALGFPEVVPRIAAQGWQQFDARAAEDVRAIIHGLRYDNTALVNGLQSTPSSFLHGDWKFGNVGAAADGRTVLIDWSYPGEGPVCHELAWYLALNAARLPISKEDTIDAFALALQRNGVHLGDWWEKQLDLCLLGGLVQFGWEKSLGDQVELDWWCDRARRAARWL
jgi:hypothetical protein